MQSRLAIDLPAHTQSGTWLGAEGALEALDPRLKHVIRSGPICNIPVQDDPFEALCLIVVYQQISGKVAQQIAARLRNQFPMAMRLPEAMLATSIQELRNVGIPERRAVTLHELARRIQDRRLDLNQLQGLPDNEVRRTLETVPGVGPWTAGMFLLFHLARPDVFLPGDIGVRKAIQRLVGYGVSPADAESIAQTWRPYRSCAMWYLWHSLPDFPSPGVR